MSHTLARKTLKLHQPLTVFCAGRGAGKSTMMKSMQQARLAGDLEQLLQALTILSTFSIPIPHRLSTTIWAYRAAIQKVKS